MTFQQLVVNREIPEISYLTKKEPEIIHPRIIYKGEVPFVSCHKEHISLDEFLHRFASGEKGLRLGGYRQSNGKQSTISFSQEERMTFGSSFLKIIEAIRRDSSFQNSKGTFPKEDIGSTSYRDTLRLQKEDSEKNLLSALHDDLEKASSQVAIEYANKPGADVDVIVKRRIGQGPFRTLLEKENGVSCWLSGLDHRQLLIASHIVPWSKSTPSQKTDPANGLLLSVSWDALFDKGLVSFDDDGKPLQNELLNKNSMQCLGIAMDVHLPRNLLTVKRKEYLTLHRKRHGFAI